MYITIFLLFIIFIEFNKNNKGGIEMSEVYNRVVKAKKFITLTYEGENIHSFIKTLRDCDYDDKQALFNVISNSSLFEYRDIQIGKTKDIVENWRTSMFFHFPLLDDNFEEETGIFHINLYMREQCFFESYLTWAKYPLNDFTQVIE